MAFKVVLVLALIAIIGISAQQQRCGPFEEYKECGTACEPTCGEEPKTICSLQCISGYFCKAGLLKSKLGCVTQSKCERILQFDENRHPGFGGRFGFM